MHPICFNLYCSKYFVEASTYYEWFLKLSECTVWSKNYNIQVFFWLTSPHIRAQGCLVLAPRVPCADGDQLHCTTSAPHYITQNSVLRPTRANDGSHNCLNADSCQIITENGPYFVELASCQCPECHALMETSTMHLMYFNLYCSTYFVEASTHWGRVLKNCPNVLFGLKITAI